jgi:N-acetylneuraminate synthase
MEPKEMADLVIEIERAWHALGGVSYGGTATEEKNKAFRRSIYVVNDIKAGEIFTRHNIRCIRPGFGLAPKFMTTTLGRKAACNITRGTPLSAHMVR